MRRSSGWSRRKLPTKPGGGLFPSNTGRRDLNIEEAVFVASANLTEAALDRNFELGLLVRDKALAASVSSHFQQLIERGMLSLLPKA
jgi:phosphatidylserine/phosphatidylglycerophosphate/cardiolipin synthase-like enzyme